MRSIRFAAIVSALLATAPAMADDYLFTVTDPSLSQSGYPLDGNAYSFKFSSTPSVGANYDASSFTITGSASYTVTFPGNPPVTYPLLAGAFTFYTDPANENFGGLDTPLNSYFGPQLFTGDTSAPTFRTGTFALDQGSSITISAAPAVAAAAPEPAAWLLTIAGAGLAGAVLRRRPRVRVAFA